MRVFLTSPWIPAEWVRAHGLGSQGIWFAEEFLQATPPLSAGTCAFAENVVQFAESKGEAVVVFTTACDQLRRGFDEAALRGSSRSFLFNLPATHTPAAKCIYRAELERLGRFLLQWGGTAPTPKILSQELAAANQTRRFLREAAPSADARSFAEAMSRFYQDGGFSPPSPSKSSADAPLAIVGGPLSMADWTLFEALKALGGFVALNATDNGERSLCPAFDSSSDPFAALLDGYFENMADVFLRPNTRLYAWLKPRLSSRRVRGIILCCFTGCDLWRAEMQTLREIFQLPVLLLEPDDAGLSPRDANRLQAFVETLR